MDRTKFAKRVTAIIVAVGLCIVVAVFRLYNLQIVNGEEYLEKSERRLSRSYAVKAPRGEILDRYGRPLVTNRTSFTIKLEAVGWREADKPQLIWDLISLCDQNGQPPIWIRRRSPPPSPLSTLTARSPMPPMSARWSNSWKRTSGPPTPARRS